LYAILQVEKPQPEEHEIDVEMKPRKTIKMSNQIVRKPGSRSKSQDSASIKIHMNPYEVEKLHSQLHELRLKNAHQRS
jgi:hypothetical protein